MFRCVACNRKLDESTLKSINPLSGETENMCSHCRDRGRSEYNILTDREYPHSGTTESTSVNNMGYFYEYFD